MLKNWGNINITYKGIRKFVEGKDDEKSFKRNKTWLILGGKTEDGLFDDRIVVDVDGGSILVKCYVIDQSRIQGKEKGTGYWFNFNSKGHLKRCAKPKLWGEKFDGIIFDSSTAKFFHGDAEVLKCYRAMLKKGGSMYIEVKCGCYSCVFGEDDAERMVDKFLKDKILHTFPGVSVYDDDGEESDVVYEPFAEANFKLLKEVGFSVERSTSIEKYPLKCRYEKYDKKGEYYPIEYFVATK